MEKREELKKRIYEIEDRIRLAPEDTPPRQIYEWYAETDTLRDELDRLDSEDINDVPNESNVLDRSNADLEERASESARDELVSQWNEDSDVPQTYSQIVGTAK